MKLPLRKSTTTRGAAEFCRRNPENLLLVRETKEGEMLIRATADNLTAQQQQAFVEYLLAEGFMMADPKSPERFIERKAYQQGLPVRWIVDASWPKADPVYALHVRRFCLCLGWLALMVTVIRC